jgi:hypothetical protein
VMIGAVRVAHLLIQGTGSRDPSDGTHEEELAALLSHPQLSVHTTDWRNAADAASLHAQRWPSP